MKPFLILLTCLLTNISYAQTKYEKDFNEFWKEVNSNYAYFDQQKINWSTVKEIYEPQVKEIGNDKDFIRLLEKVLNEFHNG